MGEYFAWAATGIVAGLQSWSKTLDQDKGRYRGTKLPETTSVQYQRFLLRQQNGRDIEILLADSGMAFRNGHAVTAVWGARAKAAYGHCIYLENHTTGGIARLQENLALIRKTASWWEIGLFGFLATFPATLVLIGWLLSQHGSSQIYEQSFLLSATVAAILLFIIGVVASKLIFDYLRTEDERKIWLAADKALFHARRLLIQKPRIRYYGRVEGNASTNHQ